MEFKVGDKVKLKGTKTAGIDDWEEYFGRYGIVKGDVVIIKQIVKNGKEFFITSPKKLNDSGKLSINDIEKISVTLKEILE